MRLDQAGTNNTVKHQSKGLHPMRIMQLKCFIGDIEYCISKINKTPTADVVEVVRCKDCKHFMEYSEEYHGKVESADGDCYLRLINSVDKQFQAVFYKGRTAEEMKKLSFGTIYGCDEYGNNKKPYNWHCPHSHMVWFGQYVTHWMPLPEPPKEVEDDG